MILADRIHEKLTRVTTSNRFIAEIDGLRFFAIAPVVIFHLRNYLTVHPVAPYTTTPDLDLAARLTHHGHYGVQLFFVISGFVLALPFAKSYQRGLPRVNLRRYFLRRLTRLEPPYILAMTACFLLLVLFRGDQVKDLLPHLAAGLAYLHGAIYADLNPVNLVAWSLEVEVQFYLAVPLLTLVFAIRSKFLRRTIIICAGVALLILQSTLMPEGGRLSWSLLNNLQFFLAGFLLADLYLNEMNEAPPRRLAWDAVALVGWPLLVLLCEWPALAHAVFAPLVLLLFCAAFCGRLMNRVVTNRWIAAVGGMCYTIYLIHFQVLSVFEKMAGSIALTSHFAINLVLHLLLFAPVLLAFSAAYFLLVEKPCMRHNWPQRLSAWVRDLFKSRRLEDAASKEEEICTTAISRASQ